MECWVGLQASRMWIKDGQIMTQILTQNEMGTGHSMMLNTGKMKGEQSSKCFEELRTQ